MNREEALRHDDELFSRHKEAMDRLSLGVGPAQGADPPTVAGVRRATRDAAIRGVEAVVIERLLAHIEHHQREFAAMALGPRADASWVRDKAIAALGSIGAFAQAVADEQDGTADGVRGVTTKAGER